MIGFCIFLRDSLVSQKSKKQATFSRSLTKMEYRVLTMVSSEITWIWHIIRDLQIVPLTPTLVSFVIIRLLLQLPLIQLLVNVPNIQRLIVIFCMKKLIEAPGSCCLFVLLQSQQTCSPKRCVLLLFSSSQSRWIFLVYIVHLEGILQYMYLYLFYILLLPCVCVQVVIQFVFKRGYSHFIGIRRNPFSSL